MSKKSVKCQTIRKTTKRFSSLLKKKGVRFSLISALFLTIACYFANNAPIFTGESTSQLYWTQLFCDFFHINKTVDYGDVLLYNTSNDKILVNAYINHDTKHPEPVGVTPISDRYKLYKFLKLLSSSDTYKYIILDLAFDKNEVSQYDDSLYNLIDSMRNIVVATDNKIEITPKLKNKSALCSYYITKINTTLTRYEYTRNDRRSIPMYVFEDLHPKKKMKRYGIGLFSIYKSDGKLCYNSNYLTFDNQLSVDNKKVKIIFDNGYKPLEYEYLGVYLNQPASDSIKIKELATYTDSAIVIIGDFVYDTHDTYMGEKPGPLIMARALQTLEEGKNIVSFFHTFIWFVVFFLICYTIYTEKPKRLFFYHYCLSVLFYLFYRFLNMFVMIGFIV